jgi:hypothetical protein
MVEVWNHGDLHPDINVTWLGLVGPGVRQEGIDPTTWCDHTDTRPNSVDRIEKSLGSSNSPGPPPALPTFAESPKIIVPGRIGVETGNRQRAAI